MGFYGSFTVNRHYMERLSVGYTPIIRFAISVYFKVLIIEKIYKNSLQTDLV